MYSAIEIPLGWDQATRFKDRRPGPDGGTSLRSCNARIVQLCGGTNSGSSGATPASAVSATGSESASTGNRYGSRPAPSRGGQGAGEPPARGPAGGAGPESRSGAGAGGNPAIRSG